MTVTQIENVSSMTKSELAEHLHNEIQKHNETLKEYYELMQTHNKFLTLGTYALEALMKFMEYHNTIIEQFMSLKNEYNSELISDYLCRIDELYKNCAELVKEGERIKNGK